jgi:hypothetical protein
VAHCYGSKGNVLVGPEVILKLMQQIQDDLMAAVQNVRILITHQTRLLIALHYLRSLSGFGQHVLKRRPRFPPAVELGRTDAYCRGSEAAGNKPFGVGPAWCNAIMVASRFNQLKNETETPDGARSI